jgi:hypothetical protein
VRCSDAERERTCSALRVAAGDGRLSLEEVEERIAEVYRARYQHELAVLTADLPAEAGLAGWRAIGAAIWRQLALEASTLLGRGVALSPRRRLVLAVVVVLVFVSMLAMAFHGFGGDGVEHHGLDHD